MMSYDREYDAAMDWLVENTPLDYDEANHALALTRYPHLERLLGAEGRALLAEIGEGS